MGEHLCTAAAVCSHNWQACYDPASASCDQASRSNIASDSAPQQSRSRHASLYVVLLRCWWLHAALFPSSQPSCGLSLFACLYGCCLLLPAEFALLWHPASPQATHMRLLPACCAVF
jgi:hypothetical protein